MLWGDLLWGVEFALGQCQLLWAVSVALGVEICSGLEIYSGVICSGVICSGLEIYSGGDLLWGDLLWVGNLLWGDLLWGVEFALG
ncbi:MAG TPA: hypothetical protein P5543_10780 [Planctomycetota bacterium]|nr:hypothetical protein [Planctomycetota bacterium]